MDCSQHFRSFDNFILCTAREDYAINYERKINHLLAPIPQQTKYLHRDFSVSRSHVLINRIENIRDPVTMAIKGKMTSVCKIPSPTRLYSPLPVYSSMINTVTLPHDASPAY